jgi:hypothetical protein
MLLAELLFQRGLLWFLRLFEAGRERQQTSLLALLAIVPALQAHLRFGLSLGWRELVRTATAAVILANRRPRQCPLLTPSTCLSGPGDALAVRGWTRRAMSNNQTRAPHRAYCFYAFGTKRFSVFVAIAEDSRFRPQSWSQIIEQVGHVLVAKWTNSIRQIDLTGRDFALFSPSSDRFPRNLPALARNSPLSARSEGGAPCLRCYFTSHWF